MGGVGGAAGEGKKSAVAHPREAPVEDKEARPVT